jgi:lipopolysaccharide assembly protein A
MQFLKTLFWVVLTVVLVLWAKANWFSVTLKLWGGLEADVKLPVLIFAAFLLGLLPALIVHYARLWSLRRRIETADRTIVTTAPAPTPASGPELAGEARVATDAKAWPAK